MLRAIVHLKAFYLEATKISDRQSKKDISIKSEVVIKEKRKKIFKRYIIFFSNTLFYSVNV